MKKVAIVTDSNSGITQTQAQELGISVIPMPFIVNDEEYFEDINLTQSEFYDKLAQDADISTSQPAIGQVAELWEELLKEYDEIVYIPMSSSLSKSCETAITFSQDYNSKVQVVDNRRISVTMKESVFDAIKLVKAGHDAKYIKDYLEKTSADSSIYIMVNTLKYLKKGGRITSAAAAIGTLLNIKPVLQIQGGKLDQFAKVMNIKVAKAKMIAQMKNDFDNRFKEFVENNEMRLYVAHTDNEERAKEFAKEIEEVFGIEVSLIDPLSLSVACHIGAGALAIACARAVK